VIEAFSHGIMAKSQFQDFCKENPSNNEEFRRVVEKMIMDEEKTRERFSDRNNRENKKTTRTREIFQTRDIQTGSANQTTPSPWLTRQKNSQNSRGSKTSRICTVYGTHKEITQ
jgi:E3 ubiquitin-protein ligase DOA10